MLLLNMEITALLDNSVYLYKGKPKRETLILKPLVHSFNELNTVHCPNQMALPACN